MTYSPNRVSYQATSGYYQQYSNVNPTTLGKTTTTINQRTFRRNMNMTTTGLQYD